MYLAGKISPIEKVRRDGVAIRVKSSVKTVDRHTGPDRITFKVTVTSPRGQLIPAGEARAVAAWRAQQASP